MQEKPDFIIKIDHKAYLRDKSKSLSLNDFIATLSKVFADKAGNEWHRAKITKKESRLNQVF